MVVQGGQRRQRVGLPQPGVPRAVAELQVLRHELDVTDRPPPQLDLAPGLSVGVELQLDALLHGAHLGARVQRGAKEQGVGALKEGVAQPRTSRDDPRLE